MLLRRVAVPGEIESAAASSAIGALQRRAKGISRSLHHWPKMTDAQRIITARRRTKLGGFRGVRLPLKSASNYLEMAALFEQLADRVERCNRAAAN